MKQDETSREIDAGGDWIAAFAVSGLIFGVGIFIGVTLAVKLSPFMAGVIAVLIGAGAGLLCAQQPFLRKALGGLVFSLIFWTP